MNRERKKMDRKENVNKGIKRREEDKNKRIKIRNRGGHEERNKEKKERI